MLDIVLGLPYSAEGGVLQPNDGDLQHRDAMRLYCREFKLSGRWRYLRAAESLHRGVLPERSMRGMPVRSDYPSGLSGFVWRIREYMRPRCLPTSWLRKVDMMIANRCRVHYERLTRRLAQAECWPIHESSRRLCRLMLVAVWVMMGYAALAQQDDNEPVRYELNPSVRHDRLPEVTAAVEVKTWEPDVRKGIELLLDITNNGAAAVELYDPVDATSVRLYNRTLDPSGGSVTLPGERGRVSLGEIKHPESRAKAIEEIKARRSFDIVSEGSRRRARNVKGVDDVEGEWNGIVRLERGEHFQMRLRVTRIMADPKKYWAECEKPRPTIPKEDRIPHPPELIPAHLSKPVPIPAGTYQLSVTILLNTPELVVAYPASSRDGELITVQLGPKPEADE